MIALTNIYPYGITFPELLLRSSLAVVIFVLLGIAIWSLMHRFIYSRDLRALPGGILLSVLGMLFAVVGIPISRSLDLGAYLNLTSLPIAVLAALNFFLLRTMGSIEIKEKRVAKKILRLVIAGALIGIFFFAGAEMFLITESQRSISQKLARADARIEEIKKEAAHLVSDLSHDPAFLTLFEEEKFRELTELTKEILSQNNLDALAVTDKHGFTVAAPHNPDLVGENLTSLSPGHSQVLAGNPLEFLSIAITTPFVLVAGVPIKDGDSVTGAIFAGRLVNQEFAKEIARIAGARDATIYCDCQKTYVTTLSDGDVNKTLANWLELVSTDPQVEAEGGFVRDIYVNGNSLLAAGKLYKNVGINHSSGFLVVLDERTTASQEIFYWVIIGLVVVSSLVIFASPVIIHRLIR